MDGECWICNRKACLEIKDFRFCKKCIAKKRNFWIPSFDLDDTLSEYFHSQGYEYVFSLHSKIFSRMIICSEKHLVKTYFQGSQLTFIPVSRMIILRRGKLKWFLTFSNPDYSKVKKLVG
jgi:hypothetical protein